MTKKCLVLDLDNTLWGGVVGEDGITEIKLGFEPPGSAFLAFQQAILDCANRGVILAVNSKNNFNDAMRVIREHPHMVLRENSFAAFRINWMDKADNIKALAKELNIGTDSMVFLDDDPVNRSLVRAMLPEVETPDLPERPEEYASFFMKLPYFQGGAVTDEDKMRGNFYVTERIRAEAEKKATSRDEFLKNLDVTVTIIEDDASSAPRLAQMTDRTNQFNARKTVFSEAEMKHFCTDGAYTVFSTSARDTFGDYGVIGLAIAEKEATEWRLISFLMSCRALGRGVEDAFFAHMAAKAKDAGAHILKVRFEKTEKNEPARTFLDKVCQSCHGGHYVHDLSCAAVCPEWVSIIA